MCRTHERAAWRLTHILDIGGVSDTPELRAEVLRKVAESDRLLRQHQCEALGARTDRDYKTTRPDVYGTGIAHHASVPYPDTVATMKAPPEEIPLVGSTPHYEWP
jgi:hypothetical protein